jgi:cytoskeletal protein RodZ
MTKNIGEILQQARKEKGLGLQTISNKLFIRAHYLEAIENNEFYLIPSRPQLLGFIRAYADHLELDSEELLSSFTEKPKDEEIVLEPDSDIDETSTANKIKSQQIFSEIGNQLRDTREKLGISLDDVALYTHINPDHIDAIEKGDLDQFSSAAQSRGMIRNYSDFLGMRSSRYKTNFQAERDFQP